MPKSILIYGSYGGGNYGDEVILDTILQNLKNECDFSVLVSGDPNEVSRMHDVNAVPLWSAPPQKTLIGKTTKLIRFSLMLNRNVKMYDAVLIGGGNMIMDLFPKNPWIIFLLCLLSKIHRKKIYFVGCGAGPIYRNTSRILFRTALKMADLVTLRDAGSYRLVRSLCPSDKNIFECADLIFSNNHFNKDNIPIKQQNLGRIAINIIAYNKPGYYPNADKEKYEDYCSFIANIISYFVSKEDTEQILLFTLHPEDDYVLEDIKKRVDSYQENKVIFSCTYTSFAQLHAALKDYDLIVSSRLHSLFLSICLNKKVIPLIYQEKVQNFVYENNIDSISIDVQNLSPQSLYRFKSIFEKFEDDPFYYSSEIATIKEKCTIKSIKNFEFVKAKIISLKRK